MTGAGFQDGAAVVFGTTAVTATVEDAGRTLTVQTPTGASRPAWCR